MNLLLALANSGEADTLIQHLEALGCRVLGRAGDGRQACRLAGELEPDLILMEAELPRMDGLSAAAEINRKRPTPVVLLGGHGSQAFLRAAAQAGVLSCLPRPLDMILLGPTLDLALANFRQQQALADEARELRQALADRKLVERAKGMLMDGLGLNEDEAMRHLQGEAVCQGLSLAEAARQMLEAGQPAGLPESLMRLQGE